MLNKFKKFIHDETGSELMQWAIIIIIVAGLAAIAYGISSKLSDKLNDASNVLDSLGVEDGADATTP